MVFVAHLSASSPQRITADYSIGGGSATMAADYTVDSATGAFTFEAGSLSSQTLTVAIVDDLLPEGDESFNVTLSNAVNATLQGGGSTYMVNGLIRDDDEATITVADVEVDEGDGVLVFSVFLSDALTGDVTLLYTLSDGTAVSEGTKMSPADYYNNAGGS